MGANWDMSCSNDNRLLSTTYKKEKVRLARLGKVQSGWVIFFRKRTLKPIVELADSLVKRNDWELVSIQ